MSEDLDYPPVDEGSVTDAASALLEIFRPDIKILGASLLRQDGRIVRYPREDGPGETALVALYSDPTAHSGGPNVCVHVATEPDLKNGAWIPDNFLGAFLAGMLAAQIPLKEGAA